jgi:acylphosphatase
MVVHVSIRITGYVQGVGFRYHARKIALALGLNGTVRNEPDGSVYAEVEGEQALVQQFIKWCHNGPALARVTDVSVTSGTFRGYDSFHVSGGFGY